MSISLGETKRDRSCRSDQSEDDQVPGDEHRLDALDTSTTSRREHTAVAELVTLSLPEPSRWIAAVLSPATAEGVLRFGGEGEGGLSQVLMSVKADADVFSFTRISSHVWKCVNDKKASTCHITCHFTRDPLTFPF